MKNSLQLVFISPEATHESQSPFKSGLLFAPAAAQNTFLVEFLSCTRVSLERPGVFVVVVVCVTSFLCFKPKKCGFESRYARFSQEKGGPHCDLFKLNQINLYFYGAFHTEK